MKLNVLFTQNKTISCLLSLSMYCKFMKMMPIDHRNQRSGYHKA